jgi:hypothetical protein
MRQSLIASSLFCSFSFAGAWAQNLPDYVCTIESVQTVGNSSKDVQLLQERTYQNKKFYVDRRTGVMSGILQNAFVARPDVVDFGSGENSYKAITILRLNQGAGAGTNVHVLIVNEWESSLNKSFVFMSNAQVFFGTCTHQL